MNKINEFIHKRRFLLGFIAVCALSVGIAAFFYLTAAQNIVAVHPTLSKALTGVIAVCCLMAILSYVIIIRLNVNSLKGYILISFVAAILFSIIVPPNAVPDEWTHYSNAYYNSNILMGKSSWNSDSFVTMRECDYLYDDGVLSPKKYSDTFDNIQIFNSQPKDAIRKPGIAFVTSSPFYVYAPQAVGISISRLLNFNGIVTYYLARMLNLLVYFILLCFAIKLMPFAKNMLAIIGTLPIALQQSMSVSPDAFILGISMFTFAAAMKIMYGKQKVTGRDIAIFLIASVMLAPCKLIYFAIPFVVLFTPKERFETKTARRITRYLVPALAVISLILVQYSNLKNHTDSDTTGTAFSEVPTYSLHIIFTDPARFVYVMLNTLKINSFFYYRTMLCSHFGLLQIATSGLMPVIYTVILLLSCMPTKKKDKVIVTVTPLQKLCSAAILLGTSFLVILSMFSAWTPCTYDYVAGVQGRYFLPVLPMIIPILRTKKFSASAEVQNYALFMSSMTTMYIIAFVFSHACTVGV